MENTPQKQLIPFANASQCSWRFPDGQVILSAFEAHKKADALGMELEKRSQWRFSDSH